MAQFMFRQELCHHLMNKKLSWGTHCVRNHDSRARCVPYVGFNMDLFGTTVASARTVPYAVGTLFAIAIGIPLKII